MSKLWRQFKSLYRNYRFQSMFFSYFRWIALVSLAFFMIFGFVAVQIYNQSTRESVSYYVEKSLSKSADMLSNLLQKIDQNHFVLSDTNEVLLFLLEDREELEQQKNYKPGTTIQDLLFYMTVESPGISSIYLYSTYNQYFASWTEFRPLAGYWDSGWLTQADTEPQFARSLATAGSPDTVTFIRNIELNGRHIGYAVYNVEMKYFHSLSGQGSEDSLEDIIVWGKDGKILYATETNLINRDAGQVDGWRDINDTVWDGGSGVTFSGKLVTASALSADGKYAIASTNSISRQANFKSSYQTIVVGGLLGLLIALVLSFIVSLRMYQYIMGLLTFINAPESSDLRHSSGEIQYISNRIISVMDRSKNIEKELAATLLDLKQAQTIALLTQINPHFILNTLQLVNLDIMKELRRDTVATHINFLLSDIIRSNLNTTDYMVPFAQEIELAKKYLEIENIRNKGKFQVIWEIDGNAVEHKTVKFILQPLLENSILHGLKSKSSADWEIRIAARLEDGYLLVDVCDNGVGIDTEALERLKARLAQNSIQENDHIGLCNVDRRIKLVFGNECGVTIYSALQEGTTIHVRQKAVLDIAW